MTGTDWVQTLRFGSGVSAKSETGHSGVAERRDRFTSDNGPSRRDSRVVVREGLLLPDVTGSIRPKPACRTAPKLPDARAGLFQVSRPRSSRW